MNNVIKSFFKKGLVGLFIALLPFFVGVEGKQISSALKQIIEETKAEVPVRPTYQPTGTTAQSTVDSDEYVQTEGHLQVDAVKKAMGDISLFYKGGVKDPRTPNQLVTPYMNLITSVINKEVEFKDSHYALYNGTGTEWRVPQDLYKQLYAYRNPSKPVKDFVFVRFSDLPSMKVQEFLAKNVEEWAGVNDNVQEVSDVLIACNLALFGGVGTQGECTWNYFLTAKSHRWPTATSYYQVLTSFGMSYDIELLAKETQALSKLLAKASPEQTLLQFLIPQDKIDDTAYLSWILGVPYNPDSKAAGLVDLMEKRLEGKVRIGSVTGPVVKKVMKKLRKDPAYASLHQELKEAVANGDFGISGFMAAYRNKPWDIKNVNDIQARLLISKDIMQNSASGVKIFSYFTTPQEIQEDYLNTLDGLVKKIIEEEKNKTAEQKAIDIAKNEETYIRLKAEEEAARAEAKAAEKKEKAEAKKK